MSILINILLVIHVLVSLLIILLVLMQRPKNEGLGAAFGGGMTDNLFGAQTTNVLQSGTRWLGGLFFCLTLLLSFLYVKNGSSKSSVQKSLSESAAVPVPAPAPIPEGAVTTPPVKPDQIEGVEKNEGTPPPTAPGEGKPEADKPAQPANPPEAPKEKAPAPVAPDPKPPEPPK